MIIHVREKCHIVIYDFDFCGSAYIEK